MTTTNPKFVSIANALRRLPSCVFRVWQNVGGTFVAVSNVAVNNDTDYFELWCAAWGEWNMGYNGAVHDIGGPFDPPQKIAEQIGIIIRE